MHIKIITLCNIILLNNLSCSHNFEVPFKGSGFVICRQDMHMWGNWDQLELHETVPKNRCGLEGHMNGKDAGTRH